MDSKTKDETAGLVRHEMLFEHQGGFFTGPWVPMGPFEGQVSLVELKQVLLEAGHQQVTCVARYQVRTVLLPSWLPVGEYRRDYVRWDTTWAYGVQTSWPESWQRGLFRLEGPVRLACKELLCTKSFKGDFRKSLCSQLVAWLESEPKAYPQPYSGRQLGHLLRDHHRRYAARLDQSVLQRHGLPSTKPTQDAA